MARVLIVYCHPDPQSFTAAIRDAVLAGLTGHETRVIDLYGEGFDPVLTLDELQTYEDTSVNTAPVASHVDALRWSDTLIFIYPTWWYAHPAMLRGWFDRVLLPGVSFHMPAGGDIRPGLTHVKRLGVFTTCGASWWLTRFVGFPGRRVILRGIRLLCDRRCRTAFVAHYKMDVSTSETRAAHLKRVRQAVARLMG